MYVLVVDTDSEIDDELLARMLPDNSSTSTGLTQQRTPSPNPSSISAPPLLSSDANASTPSNTTTGPSKILLRQLSSASVVMESSSMDPNTATTETDTTNTTTDTTTTTAATTAATTAGASGESSDKALPSPRETDSPSASPATHKKLHRLSISTAHANLPGDLTKSALEGGTTTTTTATDTATATGGSNSTSPASSLTPTSPKGRSTSPFGFSYLRKSGM